MNESKISKASVICLSRSLVTTRPFFQVKSFIEQLKTDPNWTDSEIVEVQTRVIRNLMQRMGDIEAEDQAASEQGASGPSSSQYQQNSAAD